MKSALTCHGTAWTSALAPVLLGIRSALKEDIGFSAAQLVYGESIHLPGEFFVAPANLAPRDMLARIQSHLSEFSPTPAPDHSKPSFFIHPALQSASHVMLRIDAPTPPLSPHYTGPHRVLERTDKTFTLDLNGKPKTVTIDRLKPAFVESPEPPQPRPDHVDLPLFQLHQLYPSTTTCRTPTSTCCAPTTPRYTSTATGAATAERPKPVRVTRSGRHVHFPSKLRDFTTSSLSPGGLCGARRSMACASDSANFPHTNLFRSRRSPTILLERTPNKAYANYSTRVPAVNPSCKG
ncbi:Hypothetical predicted protein [Cloeon dipterum]|uniref:Uncharacterized protein n=1 Tax=Cloeon dipterum TaxID=197152 RepID=A0A8S1D5G6_9INSE|nr:Hypothetical predicted protein [Cloeon dipterum]